MSKSGWKKLPEEERIASILQAAACCFMEKGYHSASMQDVANAANLTKGGLYHHFSSKEAIRDALLTQFLDVDRIGLMALMAEKLPADEKLVRAGELLLDGLATKRGSAPRFMAEAVACSGAVDAVTNFYGALESLLVRLFDDAQKAGLITSEKPAATLAMLYISVLDGAQIRRDMFGAAASDAALTNFVEILRTYSLSN